MEIIRLQPFLQFPVFIFQIPELVHHPGIVLRKLAVFRFLFTIRLKIIPFITSEYFNNILHPFLDLHYRLLGYLLRGQSGHFKIFHHLADVSIVRLRTAVYVKPIFNAGRHSEKTSQFFHSFLLHFNIYLFETKLFIKK